MSTTPEDRLARGEASELDLLFIVKKLARHNRHSHYYWSAYRAEPA